MSTQNLIGAIGAILHIAENDKRGLNDWNYVAQICRAALAAEPPSQEPSGLTEALAIAQWALRHPFDEWKGDAERKALDAIAAALASQKGQQK